MFEATLKYDILLLDFPFQGNISVIIMEGITFIWIIIWESTLKKYATCLLISYEQNPTSLSTKVVKRKGITKANKKQQITEGSAPIDGAINPLSFHRTEEGWLNQTQRGARCNTTIKWQQRAWVVSINTTLKLGGGSCHHSLFNMANRAVEKQNK